MNKQIELAKKLKALADRGVGGEKLNAEKMLKDLMEKHNISLTDIEGEAMTDYFFDIKEDQIKFFNQTTFSVRFDMMVRGPIPPDKIKELGLAGNILVVCTAAEYIEIEAKFAFYWRLWNEEVDVFYLGFLQANDLLMDEPNTIDREISEEERKRWRRATVMAQTVKTESYKKQIG